MNARRRANAAYRDITLRLSRQRAAAVAGGATRA